MGLLQRERSAGGGHHVAHPELMQLQHVQVSLHENAAVPLDNLRLGLRDAVEGGAFVVNVALRRIHVLRGALAQMQRSPPKSYRSPAAALNGKDHPSAEPIVAMPLPLDRQPRLHQQVRAEARLQSVPGERGGRVQRVAQPKGSYRLWRQSTLLEVGQANRTALRVLH